MDKKKLKLKVANNLPSTEILTAALIGYTMLANIGVLLSSFENLERFDIGADVANYVIPNTGYILSAGLTAFFVHF